jgi:small subunit ribosomal protein S15
MPGRLAANRSRGGQKEAGCKDRPVGYTANQIEGWFHPIDAARLTGRQAAMTLTKERKKELIGAHRRGTADTGSAEIQIALLTGRISHLTDHFKKHSKDFASRRGLLKMVSRRRRLLDYLKRVSPQRYLDIIRSLGIRK